jgi:hypothetical protein
MADAIHHAMRIADAGMDSLPYTAKPTLADPPVNLGTGDHHSLFANGGTARGIHANQAI